MPGAEALSPWWVFVLLGLCGGVLGSLLGIGAGTLFIPILVLFMTFSQKTAQGMSLAVMVPMALVAAIRYKLSSEGTFDLHLVALLAAGAVVGALLGAELAQRLPANVLRRIFAVYIIVMGVRMLWPAPEPVPPASPPAAVRSLTPPAAKEATLEHR